MTHSFSNKYNEMEGGGEKVSHVKVQLATKICWPVESKHYRLGWLPWAPKVSVVTRLLLRSMNAFSVAVCMCGCVCVRVLTPVWWRAQCNCPCNLHLKCDQCNIAFRTELFLHDGNLQKENSSLDCQSGAASRVSVSVRKVTGPRENVFRIDLFYDNHLQTKLFWW